MRGHCNLIVWIQLIRSKSESEVIHFFQLFGLIFDFISLLSTYKCRKNYIKLHWFEFTIKICKITVFNFLRSRRDCGSFRESIHCFIHAFHHGPLFACIFFILESRYYYYFPYWIIIVIIIIGIVLRLTPPTVCWSTEASGSKSRSVQIIYWLF